MGIAVMKGLRFVDTQESCFEVSKRSYFVCAAVLCGRYSDVQELRFIPEKRFRNVLCRTARGSIYELSRMVFSVCESFK